MPTGKTVQAMRDQLSQDIQILASLDPSSETHRRLSARIQRDTNKMLDYEEQSKQRQRAYAAAAATKQHRREETYGVGTALFLTALGGVIIYTGWGSWWLLLGIFFVASGLVGIFAKDSTST